MARFVIVLDEGGAADAAAVRARLQAAYGDVFDFSPNCMLVATDAVAKQVAIAGGISEQGLLPIEEDGGGGSVSGAVFRINGYSGFADPSLWEWLTAKAEG